MGDTDAGNFLAAPVLSVQVLHDLLDGIEAMDHEAITQRAPTDVFPALDADVDEHERFGQKPCAHHPLREPGITVLRRIHYPFLLALPGLAFCVQKTA